MSPARNYTQPQIVNPQIEEKKKRVVVRKVKKQKKHAFYSLQGLFVFSSVVIFAMLLGSLYFDSQIDQIHYETELLRMNIAEAQIINEQLYAEISELSMYSRVIEIARANGLDYHDNLLYIGY